MRLHVLHRAWRVLPAGARRAALSRAAALLAPRPDGRPPALADPQAGLVVGGEIARASGLGEGARLMLAALPTLGIRALPLRAGVAVPGEAEAPAGLSARDLPPGTPVVLHVNAPLLPAALLRLPRGFLRGRTAVGYWAWELEVAAPGWRVGVPFVHEVWTPSRFSADALAPLLPRGKTVRVVPHPVAVSPPRPAPLGRADFGLPEAAFVVLVSFSLASSFERKNPLGAVAAFRAAFGRRADRILLLKVAHAGHETDDLARLRQAIGDLPNARLETRVMPAPDSHALTRCADVVLSLHRSEGFGLVPAEAMLLGRPVVATDYSGTAEFLDASCGVPVGYRLVPARDPRRVFEAPGARWAEADTGEAAAALTRLAEDAEERRRLGEAARRAAAGRLGAEGLARAVRGLGFPVPAGAA